MCPCQFYCPAFHIHVTDLLSDCVNIVLEYQNLIPSISDILKLSRLSISPHLIKKGTQMWEAWKSLADEQSHLRYKVTIALVGKYTSNADSYVRNHSIITGLGY